MTRSLHVVFVFTLYMMCVQEGWSSQTVRKVLFVIVATYIYIGLDDLATTSRWHLKAGDNRPSLAAALTTGNIALAPNVWQNPIINMRVNKQVTKMAARYSCHRVTKQSAWRPPAPVLTAFTLRSLTWELIAFYWPQIQNKSSKIDKGNIKYTRRSSVLR